MRHRLLIIPLFYCLFLIGATPATACVFNVRETGFVELQPRHYQAFLFVDSSLSANAVNHYREVAGRILMDTNVQFSIIDVGKKSEETRPYWDGETIPCFAVVSPDGQSLRLDAADFEQALLALVTSPKREEIVEKAIRHYAVVFFVEGLSPQENHMARGVVESAVTHVAGKMEMMPKPIRRPPAVVTLSHSSLQQEKILLWSLGLNAEAVSRPAVAVIYGRGRWLGPIFSGNYLTKQNLVDLLLVVGADCECGLDQKWLQGTRLPLAWGPELQKLAAREVGFDAENPYVRTEMMAIIRNSLILSPHTGPLHAFPGTAIREDSASVGAQQATPRADSGLSATVRPTGLTTRLGLLFAILALVVLGTGFAILVRNRNKA